MFVKTLDGETLINLDNVTQIEYDGGTHTAPSLDVWLVGAQAPVRFSLKQSVKHYHIMERLRKALAPLYEGRSYAVLGTEMTLDLTDLQETSVRF